MAGRGSLLAEAARMFPDAHYLGMDMTNNQLRRMAQNFHVSRSGASFDVLTASVTANPCLRPGSVDAILCDLPYGRMYGSQEANRELYPRALATMATLLRKGGRAVFITAKDQQILLEESASTGFHAYWPASPAVSPLTFALTSRYNIGLGSLSACISVFSYGDAPAPDIAQGQ